jgi:chaperonin GroES
MSLSAYDRHLQFHVDEDFKLKHLMQDRILVRPIKEQSVIMRIESERNKPTRGLVLAAGPGKIDAKGRRHPLDVKEGDTIVFGQHAVVEIFIGTEKLLITREENVFGVEEIAITEELLADIRTEAVNGFEAQAQIIQSAIQ